MYCNVTAHTGRLVVYLVLWKSVMTLLLLLTLLVLVFGRPSLFIVNRQKDTDWLLAQLLLTCVTPACTYILSKHIKSSQMTQLKTYKHAYTLRNKRGEITWTKAPIGAVSYLFFEAFSVFPCCSMYFEFGMWGRFVCVPSFSTSISRSLIWRFFKFWCNKIEMFTANVCLIMFNVTKRSISPN